MEFVFAVLLSVNLIMNDYFPSSYDSHGKQRFHSSWRVFAHISDTNKTSLLSHHKFCLSVLVVRLGLYFNDDFSAPYFFIQIACMVTHD